MKAETREHTAWRTLGLLPRDEQSAFDAAAEADPVLAEARGRMDALAAALSVAHSRPVAPGAAVLGLIEERCGLSGRPEVVISRVRLRSVLSWAGWGVAAALAVLLAVRDRTDSLTAGQNQPPPAGTPSDLPRRPEKPVAHPVRPPDKSLTASPVRDKTPRPLVDPGTVAPDRRPTATTVLTHPPGEMPVPGSTSVEQPPEPAEKRRLIQEIETLRAELNRTQQRNREMLSPAPGRSWPLIVEMKSPSASREDSDPPLSSQIADALAGKSAPEPKPAAEQKQPGEFTAQLQTTAIPVYDPARDTGTLAVRNLPAVAAGSQYNLWVSTADSSEPVFVGTLPDNLHSTDSLDFSLGSTGIIPTSYYLTMNSVDLSSVFRVTGTDLSVMNRDQLVLPNSSNIVLQGP